MTEHLEMMSLRLIQTQSDLANEQMRPFHLLKPAVFPDGNAWIAMYGPNLQESITGCGDTPAKAAYDFDHQFHYGLTKASAPQSEAA